MFDSGMFLCLCVINMVMSLCVQRPLLSFPVSVVSHLSVRASFLEQRSVVSAAFRQQGFATQRSSFAPCVFLLRFSRSLHLRSSVVIFLSSVAPPPRYCDTALHVHVHGNARQAANENTAATPGSVVGSNDNNNRSNEGKSVAIGEASVVD